MYLGQIKGSTISDEEFVFFVEQKIQNSWIIVNNPYTNWFRRGDVTIQDIQRLIIELASYENFLYIAHCLKSMYAPISNGQSFILNLLNKQLGKKPSYNEQVLGKSQIFDFHNVQCELLLDTAEAIGLNCQDLQPTKALKSSLEFGKEGLISLIGNKNQWVAAGASLANEIGLSYWHPLHEGIQLFNEQRKNPIPVNLFEANKAASITYYSRIKQEIKHLLSLEELNRQQFVIGVEYFLKEFAEFWEGLCSDYIFRAEKRCFKH